MTASQTAKAAGLASLKELTEMSKQSPQTLTNWYNNKPELFDLVVKGAVVIKLKKAAGICAFCSRAPGAPSGATVGGEE